MGSVSARHYWPWKFEFQRDKSEKIMNKVYPSPRAALEGLIENGMILAVGGLGLRGIPDREPYPGSARNGQEGPDRREQQRGRGRLRPWAAAADVPNSQDGVELRGRER
jgi:hypothetical protein